MSAKNPALADLLSINGTPKDINKCAMEILRVIRPQLYENLIMQSAIGRSLFKMGRIAPSELKSGPIRHHDLPASLLIRIQNIWFATSDICQDSLEQTIETFQRDLQPEKEVEIWEHIVGALQIASYSLDNGYQRRKELFSVLLRFSFGDNKQVVEDFNNGKIPEEIFKTAAQAWIDVVPDVTISDVDQK